MYQSCQTSVRADVEPCRVEGLEVVGRIDEDRGSAGISRSAKTAMRPL